MAQRTTKFIKGEFYHIYNRGCGRERLFKSPENYRFLQRKLFTYSKDLKITIVAHCLMPNHYHLLLRQDEDTSAGYFVRQVFNSYTKAFNKMYARSGTLFEGPFKSKHIDDESYFLYLCRYIHRNPLEAHLVMNIADWEYSDYQIWIHSPADDALASEFIRGYFTSPAQYEEFVAGSEPQQISYGLKRYVFD